ncbi:MAG: YbaN family protein [Cellulosilyticaceae bacterium]
MKKKLYIVLGLIAFGLGAIGVILPILPTTPFLLLASCCFVRGSERVNEWFIHTGLYQKHLASFIENKQMTRKQKIMIPLVATLMILIPFGLVDNSMMRLFLIGIIVVKWYYFAFRIKTIPKATYETIIYVGEEQGMSQKE